MAGFREAWRWRSGNILFNPGWYREIYPDLSGSGSKLLKHYETYGWKERRSPHPLFDVNFYEHFSVGADIVHIPHNKHYERFGWKEGREPHPLFDGRWYLATYPEVARIGVAPLVHYLRVGWQRGFNPHPLFDVTWYLEAYPDVAAAGREPLSHYVACGWQEGRRPHPLFDTVFYLEQNPDVREGGHEPLAHYSRFGWREGRRPNPLFDPLAYAATLGDGGGEPLGHYITRGEAEGRVVSPLFDADGYGRHLGDRISAAKYTLLGHFLTGGWRSFYSASPLFDPHWYLERNPDLLPAGVNPMAHYLVHGWREGRKPHPLVDPTHMRNSYPEVDATGQDPLTYYLVHGGENTPSPSPVLDMRAYARVHCRKDDGSLPNLLDMLANGDLPPGSVTIPFDAEYFRRVARLPATDRPVDLLIRHLDDPAYCHAPACPPRMAIDDEERPLKRATRRSRTPDGRDGFAAPLIVAGFHRSGTSMVTNLLADAGLFVGHDLLGASYSNPYGHYEDRAIIKFHDKLLVQSGTNWQTPEPFVTVIHPEDYQWMAEYGIANSDKKCWGFKDPRVTLFLEEWVRVFPDASVLYLFRPAVDCVHSLKRRAYREISLNKGVRILRRFWDIPDLAVRMYVNYAERSLNFLERFEGNSCVVPLNDLVQGREIVKEIKQHWGYALHDAQFLDVFDPKNLTTTSPNEVVYDPSLLDRVREVEDRFLALATRGIRTTPSPVTLTDQRSALP